MIHSLAPGTKHDFVEFDDSISPDEVAGMATKKEATHLRF